MPLWTLKDKTTLVVDDIPEMRSILRSMVVGYGATDVHQARSGDEAIEHLAARRFDLVLCDYNLGPGRDGQQVLEEARHRGLLPRATAFVMITAENASGMVMGALEHQPDAYLSKPVPKSVLQPRLRKLFERKARLAPVHAALDAGDPARALELVDAQLAEDGRYRLALLEIRCELLARLGRADDVEALCEAVLAERELPWASLALGRAHFQRGELEVAVETFEDVVDYSPSYVEAYDWLARTQRACGDARAAQATLERAVDRSPKSLPRQRALAELAEDNDDLELAEKAWRAALRVGQNSIARLPTDHTGLARVLVANGKGREALATLDGLRRDHSGDDGAALEADAAEVSTHRALGDETSAREGLARAMRSYERAGAGARPALALGLLEACLELGEDAHADVVAAPRVRNHQDDEAVVTRLEALYDAAGRAEEGAAIIRSARDEAVRINNEGVSLLQAGKVEESIELFTRALRGMPGNAIVNLNAAQSLAMSMQKGRVTRRRLDQAMSCLEVVGTARPTDARYRKLLAICSRLAAARPS